MKHLRISWTGSQSLRPHTGASQSLSPHAGAFIFTLVPFDLIGVKMMLECTLLNIDSIEWKETNMAGMAGMADMADISKAWCASWWKGIAYHPSGELKKVSTLVQVGLREFITKQRIPRLEKQLSTGLSVYIHIYIYIMIPRKTDGPWITSDLGFMFRAANIFFAAFWCQIDHVRPQCLGEGDQACQPRAHCCFLLHALCPPVKLDQLCDLNKYK